MRLRGIIGALIILASPCAAQPLPQRELPQQSPNFQRLIGGWLAEVEIEGTVIRWLTQRRAEGDYESVKRIYQDEVYLHDTTERGTWSVDNDMLIEHSTTLETYHKGAFSPPAEHRADEHRILELSDDSVTFADKANGVRYRVRRVPATFRLADPGSDSLGPVDCTPISLDMTDTSIALLADFFAQMLSVPHLVVGIPSETRMTLHIPMWASTCPQVAQRLFAKKLEKLGYFLRANGKGYEIGRSQ